MSVDINRVNADMFNDSALIKPSNKYTWFEKPKLKVSKEMRNTKNTLTFSTNKVWLNTIQQIDEKIKWKRVILS